MPFKSKRKRRSYLKTWRKKNKSKQNEYSRKWKSKLKIWYSEYKTLSKCAICKESRNSVLESHHIKPENKAFCLHEGVKRGISIRRLEIEASKCIVLCANHHKLVHYGGLNPDEQQIWTDRLRLFEEQGGNFVHIDFEPTKSDSKSPKKTPKSRARVRNLKSVP